MQLKAACFSVALGTFLVPLAALASLGGDVGSVRVDQQQLNATLKATAATRYTLFEMQTPSGTFVRQYVSAAGTVFALVWEGPSLPDLRQLLGHFFEQYARGSDNQGPGTGPLIIDQPGLSLYAGGRMRAFLGRALIPGLVPKGMSAEDVR